MSKKQLQKLAGIKNKAQDFDLSDNPLQMSKKEKQELINRIFRGLEEGDSVTILRDDIVKIFPKYEKKLEAFAKLENDLYDAFERLYGGDDEDDDLDEAEDFDLSDNPVPASKYKRGEITFRITVTKSVYEEGVFTINLQDFADYLQEYGDTGKSIEELLKDPNDVELNNELAGYARENDLHDEMRENDWDIDDEKLKVLNIKIN